MKDEDADEFHHILRTHPDPPQYYAEKTLGSREDFFAVMSSALRSFVMAPAGRSLLVSDFASIESRVLAWLSGCKPMLQAYHKKECVYSQFASRIYNRPIEGKGPERQLGKVAVLGLGYGMGEKKFIETAATDPRTPDISVTEMVRQLNPRRRVWETVEQTKGKIIVDLYRRTYPEIPALWRDSEEAMKMAISTGQPQTCGFLTFGCTYPWAWIRLPSGRFLWYYEPQVDRVPSKFREGRTEQKISHMTVDAKTKKWVRRSIWGGLCAENVTQAVAADLLQAAIHRIDETGRYETVLTVHDEVVAEGEPGSRDEYHRLMTVVPDWATGCPIEAESHEKRRYGK